jgi:hypothetical protein
MEEYFALTLAHRRCKLPQQHYSWWWAQPNTTDAQFTWRHMALTGLDSSALIPTDADSESKFLP